MTTGNKIATVSFWLGAIAVAGVCAWYNLRPDVARNNPPLFLGALFLCGAAAFGVRECVRVLKDRQGSATGLATVAFWLGVGGFFVLAGIVAWAVVLK